MNNEKEESSESSDNSISLKASKLFLIKRKIIEWSMISTSHGYSRIFQINNKYLKIMWAFFFIISSGSCGYFVFQNIIDYFKFEVITKIRVVNEASFKFPAISICNQNPFLSRRGNQFLLDHFREMLNNSEIFDYSDLRMHLSEHEISYELDTLRQKPLDPNFSSELRKMLGYELEEILLSCYFDSMECNSSDFQSDYHPVYGQCYK
jgi:hypothetical protein